MYAVIFEVHPKGDSNTEYLAIAEKLRAFLADQEGFISIERFKSMVDDGKMLSLSFWESEEAIAKWRNVADHRFGQRKGLEELFHDYRIRVAEVVRDYTHEDRDHAPEDSNQELKE